MKKAFVIFLLALPALVYAAGIKDFNAGAPPRMRVIIDNDFGGDPDGLFQLAHHVLSPSVELRGIIGSHLNSAAGFGGDDKVDLACSRAREVLHHLGADSICPVVAGARSAMPDGNTPMPSDGATLIINEARRTDTELPLYVACGAGLTNIGSALTLAPDIADRITLVWIGGQEYEGTAPIPPGGTEVEYNMMLSPGGAQAVFNNSNVRIWQVPRNAYRQCIAPMSQLFEELEPCGPTGTYLMTSLTDIMRKLNKWGHNMGETYVLGDSPLVLLTALQTDFESDPASSDYITVAAPNIDAQGRYVANPTGCKIRVYQRIDVPLMLNDMYSTPQRNNNIPPHIATHQRKFSDGGALLMS